MKIYAYQVKRISKSIPLLETVLDKIYSERRLNKREKTISKSLVRVENIKKNDDGIWLIDFVKDRKGGGPGKAGKNKKVEGFTFERGDFFAEETAALFIPKSNFILIQFNQNGVRAPTIAKYLSIFGEEYDNAYEFLPKLDADSERRLRNKTIVRKVSMGVCLSKVTDADRDYGEPLSKVIAFGRHFGDYHIKVEASVGDASKKAKLSKPFEFIESARSFFSRNQEAVTNFEISGKDNEDSKVEMIDLVAQRLTVDIDIKPRLTDLRLSMDDRWQALIRAMNGWRDVLK